MKNENKLQGLFLIFIALIVAGSGLIIIFHSFVRSTEELSTVTNQMLFATRILALAGFSVGSVLTFVPPLLNKSAK